MRLRPAAAICAATLAIVSPSWAGEWRIGVGYDDVFELGDGHATLGAELQGSDLLMLGQAGLGLGVAARIDADGELWAGAGPVLRIEIGRAHV